MPKRRWLLFALTIPFVYRRMPFGLCNAPGTFQRCVPAIFSKFVKNIMKVFTDDFSIFRATFDMFLENLVKVLLRYEEVTVKVDRAKVEIIKWLSPPTNVKGMKSFLCHLGFYHHFIKDFSKIAKPLTHLLAKDTPFVFTNECFEAFKRIKEALISTPIIQPLDCLYHLNWCVMQETSLLGQCSARRHEKAIHDSL